ncbi:ChbG/HpnK family deacetylase [Novosphingobium sp. G106]|nr:ChbG/HpnK family deacetylase [Novosphingobium sp. G106]
MRLAASCPASEYAGVAAKRARRPRISLCADDFAHSRGTSEVIVNLAHGRRINAISCMTVRPGWRSDARLLSGLEQHCEIGLQLVLSDERPLTAMPGYAAAGTMPPLSILTSLPMSAQLTGEIAVEVARQFDAFSQVVGRPPDFVTSHGHMHQLPVLREVILEEAVWRAPEAWLRSCGDRPLALLRRGFRGKAMRSAWHSYGYTDIARGFGLETNHSFAGHYDYSESFAAAFPRFFDGASDHHVIMLHPGAADRADDPIAEARVREAAFLECYRPPEIAASPVAAVA